MFEVVSNATKMIPNDFPFILFPFSPIFQYEKQKKRQCTYYKVQYFLFFISTLPVFFSLLILQVSQDLLRIQNNLDEPIRRIETYVLLLYVSVFLDLVSDLSDCLRRNACSSWILWGSEVWSYIVAEDYPCFVTYLLVVGYVTYIVLFLVLLYVLFSVTDGKQKLDIERVY